VSPVKTPPELPLIVLVPKELSIKMEKNVPLVTKNVKSVTMSPPVKFV